MDRREFIKYTAAGAAAFAGAAAWPFRFTARAADRPPNILFAVADDWSWPHASSLGDPCISTPVFDKVARGGVTFTNAFCAAPQCAPNRASILTGRNIWQNEEAGTHGSIFPAKFDVFPDILEAAGYHAGFTGKGWAPGDWGRGGRKRNPAGREYNELKFKSVPSMGIDPTDYAGNFDLFLKDRPAGAPFCFWYGGNEPHRIYEAASGQRRGKMKPEDAPVPAFLPDLPEVRSDILDYFFEIEWFDRQLGGMLKRLHEAGELDNTMVVVTSDNGMPFPRAKANLYDYGTHVPLAVMWPAAVPAGASTDAPFSFVDFAPTFLAAAGVDVPAAMSGVSFLDFLTGRAPAEPRSHVLTGRERHGHARYDNLGYPSRAIRTKEHLYIRNFRAERWPAGDPELYNDVDDSPTKNLMITRRGEFPELFDLAFGKRPEEELYSVARDPYCLKNLAGEAEYESARKDLKQKLESELEAQGDPRMRGSDVFDSYPRCMHMNPALGGFSKSCEYNPKYMENLK